MGFTCAGPALRGLLCLCVPAVWVQHHDQIGHVDGKLGQTFLQGMKELDKAAFLVKFCLTAVWMQHRLLTASATAKQGQDSSHDNIVSVMSPSPDPLEGTHVAKVCPAPTQQSDISSNGML